MTLVKIEAMTNVHSHAFQRGLRGVADHPPRAETQGADFWSWRRVMFELAASLDPDSIYESSLEAYREMACAGYGVVGEFHYVHHQPDGRPYAEPNAMAIAVAEAAREAGLRIVLLPAAYHRNGWDGADRPPSGPQRRFCDRDVETFLARVDELRAWAAARPEVDVGLAAHSVRAVPASWLRPMAEYAQARGMVRHIHAHEQVRELEECRAEHGLTPVGLLEVHGFLGPTTTIVHGIHVSQADVRSLARSGSIVAACPITEANLGDGFVPVLAYRDAGVPLAIGSDSNIRIDPFEEVRELETIARRAGQTRSALLAPAGDLWAELCRNGRRSLGIASAPGLAIDTSRPELAGISAEHLPFAIATCASAAVVVGLEAAEPEGSLPGSEGSLPGSEWGLLPGSEGSLPEKLDI
jgi:formimidoylglutamate deiminase